MNPTKNDLPDATRSPVCALLNERLADAVDLATQAKQAHWNVKGSTFIALHELFDEVHEAIRDYADELAERCVQLGGTAEGTARMVAKKSALAEYGARGTSGRDHAEALATALAAFGKGTRRAIDQADELRDKVTSDLFTEVTSGVDKWLWMVESHLQG